MIIESLMDVAYGMLDLAICWINIPSLPEGAYNMMDEASQYIEFGLGFLASFTHIEYLLILFGIVVAVEGGFYIYKFIMWILRKIPIANMK